MITISAVITGVLRFLTPADGSSYLTPDTSCEIRPKAYITELDGIISYIRFVTMFFSNSKTVYNYSLKGRKCPCIKNVL